MAQRKNGIMLNLDGDWFYHSRKEILDRVDESYAKAFIDQYKDTDITDLVFCIAGLLSSCPSDVMPFYGDRCLVTEELGQKVDYSGTVAEWARRIWVDNGLDLYRIWTERCRENGINPWLSYRLNDAHCLNDVPHVLVPPEIYEHFEDRSVVRHHCQIGYFDRCRDFEAEEVRKQWLDYMEETIRRYRPHGIELDYQRELYCFRPGHEWSGMEVMTEFVAEVKQLTERLGRETEQDIKIAVRCHPVPQYCMEFGLDIIEWARRGLVDVVIPSARWKTVNNDIPVRLWKKILSPYDVKLAVGLEWLINAYPRAGKNSTNTLETALGSAVGALSEGADKIYLFNYFDNPAEMMLGERRNRNGCIDLSKAEGMYSLLTMAGNLDKAVRMKRRHVITYCDQNPICRREVRALPAEFSRDFRCCLRFVTGRILKGSRCTLRLGIRTEDASAGEMEVYLNCVRVDFTQVTDCGIPNMTESPVFEFEISWESLEPEVQIAELLLREQAGGTVYTVDYADITVEPFME